MASNARISLTKKQIQEGIGAELLTLCQTVTEDGSLSKEEIVALRNWLRLNRDADIPAITFLVTVVERITADGKVTRDELHELQLAIEKILPLQDRKKASAARKAIEFEIENKLKAARDEQEREEYERLRKNAPVFMDEFPTAGVFYEGRDKIVDQFVSEGDPVYLSRDFQNKFSRHAVEIRIGNGKQIGFVRDEIAAEMAPMLEEGLPYRASVKKLWSCDRGTVPIIEAAIYRANAEVDGLSRASTTRQSGTAQFSKGGSSSSANNTTGCALYFFAAVSIAAVSLVARLLV